MSLAKLLLCTDMDRTIIPNGAQPEHADARQRFKNLCALPEVTLAYVTGRHQSLVSDAITEFNLPVPDYAITDVGTKIYHIEQNQWQVQQNWEQQIDKGWHGKNHQQLHQLLSNIKDLTLQESSKQNTHKLSYYLPMSVDEKSIFEAIEQSFSKAGIEASLIYSVDEEKDIGLLDILPPNATKLDAIVFLQQQLGYAHSQVIFAGDSGNDLPVLVSAVQSVLVNNASDEIKHIAQEQALQQGYEDALFIADSHGLNMNGNYTAGVLHGVWHYAKDYRLIIEQVNG